MKYSGSPLPVTCVRDRVACYSTSQRIFDLVKLPEDFFPVCFLFLFSNPLHPTAMLGRFISMRQLVVERHQETHHVPHDTGDRHRLGPCLDDTSSLCCSNTLPSGTAEGSGRDRRQQQPGHITGTFCLAASLFQFSTPSALWLVCATFRGQSMNHTICLSLVEAHHLSFLAMLASSDRIEGAHFLCRLQQS